MSAPLIPANWLAGDDLDAWDAFERHMRVERKSGRTIESRGQAVAQLAAFLGKRGSVVDARRADIERYLIDIGTRRTAATQHNRHGALRAWFKFLAERGVITSSPMAGMKAPAPNYKVPDVLTDDQLVTLLRACAGKDMAALRDTAIVRVLCEIGSPRVSELRDLMLDDVDLKEKVIRIRHGKGDKYRVIGISDLTSEAIWLYKRARAKHKAAGISALWLGKRGPMTISGLEAVLIRRSRSAGLPRIHPHQLRHTAFADADDHGISINAAMDAFGWSTPDMAHHYGKAARAARSLRTIRGMERGNRLAV